MISTGGVGPGNGEGPLQASMVASRTRREPGTSWNGHSLFGLRNGRRSGPIRERPSQGQGGVRRRFTDAGPPSNTEAKRRRKQALSPHGT